ncbi:hypothetical protein [Vibrio sp.]|uniref:hypothetical protein n=1 Tax=Vibrio sp. TaxID=678 RepID=UPI00311F82C0
MNYTSRGYSSRSEARRKDWRKPELTSEQVSDIKLRASIGEYMVNLAKDYEGNHQAL